MDRNRKKLNIPFMRQHWRGGGDGIRENLNFSKMAFRARRMQCLRPWYISSKNQRALPSNQKISFFYY